VAKLMVSRGANINLVDKQGVSPLRVAVNTGNVDLANFFLERNAEGINDKVKDTQLIDLACARKYYDLVELLVKHGARMTDRVLKMAIKDCNLRLLRLCVAQKMELPQTALYLACKKGELDLARVMIEDLRMTPDLSCVKYARESRKPKFEAWIRGKAAEELATKCLGCGKHESADLKLLRCGKCKMVKFCGVACQKAEQKAHAPYCAPPPDK
jgi:ankyrin repeat protein